MAGQLRVAPEDFVVDEVPAYPPSGDGDHLFVHLEKRDLTTPEAARRLADALGVDVRQAGWAGLKDRHGVTRQWMSFAGATRQAALDLGESVEGLRVLGADHHRHKLRTGHLRANHFTIRLRDAPRDRLTDARAVLDRLVAEGLPNYFGEQRFGRDGRTLEDAQRWIVAGGRPPRDRFRRKLLASAFQSALFNAVVARRLDHGLLGRCLRGDVLRKETSGGLFVAVDPTVEDRRLAAWELSPTGPLPGPKMTRPADEAAEFEAGVAEALGLPPDGGDGGHAALWARLGRAAPGTRRAVRVRPTEASVSGDEAGLVFAFTLPSGSYATVLLREVTKTP